MTGQLVRVQPCAQHLGCFHNYGGIYQVLRRLRHGAVVLQHIPSGNVGLADMDEILPAEEIK